MTFTPFDPQRWPRREVFHYFSALAPTGYSLTVHLNVTALRQALRARNRRFYPAYLWLVTRNLNRQSEMKTTVRDGRPGYFDTLTPLYAVFHEDDHTFSLLWTPFDEDFDTFYAHHLENVACFGDRHGPLSQPQTPPPENAYTVSCLPWVSFEHFAVHSYGVTPYFLPYVEAGRFIEQDGRTLLPLSITCHHAATDGWHVHQFLDALQREADSFEAVAWGEDAEK